MEKFFSENGREFGLSTGYDSFWAVSYVLLHDHDSVLTEEGNPIKIRYGRGMPLDSRKEAIEEAKSRVRDKFGIHEGPVPAHWR